MALISCPECERQISDQATSCPDCGFALPKVSTPEETLYSGHPAMFRNNPVGFIICVLLVLLYGLGLLLLGIWWLQVAARTLTVTNKRTILREGLISKKTNEVLHSHIRNIQMSQGVFQRLTGVGKIAISSSGQSDVEIVFDGLANPERIKSMIEERRG